MLSCSVCVCTGGRRGGKLIARTIRVYMYMHCNIITIVRTYIARQCVYGEYYSYCTIHGDRAWRWSLYSKLEPQNRRNHIYSAPFERPGALDGMGNGRRWTLKPAIAKPLAKQCLDADNDSAERIAETGSRFIRSNYDVARPSRGRGGAKKILSSSRRRRRSHYSGTVYTSVRTGWLMVIRRMGWGGEGKG